MASTGDVSYTGLRDMVDGGGPGASGSMFGGGGALSRGLNAAGVAPLGSRGYLNFRDRFDGGGPGESGATFEGGMFSGGLNTLGVRPLGQGMGTYDARPPTRSKRATLPAAAPAPVVEAAPGPSGEEVSQTNAANSVVPTFEAGGYVGRGGAPIRPSTVSLDLPPALARLLEMPMQSYAEGGMVGPGGAPQRPMASPMAMNVAQQGGAPVVGLAPQGGQGRPLNFAAVDQQAQQFMQQNPQQVEQIRAQVQQAMAAGEVDARSLNMFVQIATTALQNPEMWPQLRQVLIQQGMLDAEDIGEEYDQGFLIILYIIGKTMGGGQMTTPAPAPMSAGQPPQMSMAEGGALPTKGPNPDGSIPINAHEGEYVIPADVTRRLGTDHFDKLIAKARGENEKGAA